MSRAPRIQVPGAFYHVTSRGNRRARIYLDDRDHLIWLDTLGEAVKRFNFRAHAFCMMPNHFHLILACEALNLPEGMHFLNSRYCQRFNHRHSLTGHVVQGRYHSVVIRHASQLLETARYVSLNPVRAQLVREAGQWRWSSHYYLVNPAFAPDWLEQDWILHQFGQGQRAQQLSKYQAFVAAGINLGNPLDHRTECRNEAALKKQLAALSLAQYAAMHGDQAKAMAHAYLSRSYTRQQIAEHFHVSVKTVSRAIQKFSGAEGEEDG